MYPLNFSRASGIAYPFIRDDHKTLSFQCKQNGAPKNIAGATFAFEIYTRTGGTLLRTLPCSILDAAQGTWRAQWAPADGAVLLPETALSARVLRYRVQRTLGGVVTTLIAGEFEVLARPPDISLGGGTGTGRNIGGAAVGGSVGDVESLTVTLAGETLVLEIGTVAAPGGEGGAGVTDHGALSGLSDDDHPQYHNDSRGDARYSQLGHTHSIANVTGLQAALDAKQPLDATLTAIAALDPSNGLIEQTGADTFTKRAIGVGTAASIPARADADLRYEASGAVAAHAAASDPHAQYQREAEKGVAGGYASLDGSGQVPAAQIPAIAITDYLGSVASQAAMLALAGQKGDWCNRSDTGAMWIITGADPSILAGWTQVVYPVSPVTSVAGRTGDVTLSSSDISGLGNAATRNVGTAAGTVAAGDDSRITGAVQGSRSIATQHSLTGGGDLTGNRTLALVGDTASPGNSKVYGTDASGNRGWFDQSTGGGTPGGSGTQITYRVDATTFGGIPGTAVDTVNNRVGFGAGSSPAATVHVQCDAASETALIAQTVASQTANGFEVRDSAGVARVYVKASGSLVIAPNGDDQAGLTVGDWNIGVSGALSGQLRNGQTNGTINMGESSFILSWPSYEANLYSYRNFKFQALDGHLLLRRSAIADTVTFSGWRNSGTNAAGAKVCLSAGIGTGNSTPAVVAIQTTTALGSGSTEQTARDVLNMDGNTTSGETPMLLLDCAKGTLQRVSFGAADSGGTGFKLLRVPN